MPKITALHIYPVKGAKGLSQSSIRINAATGVEGDRQTAIVKRSAPLGKWTNRGLYSAISTPQIANLVPDPTNAPEALRQALDLPNPPATLQAEGRFNFTYTKGPTVSLLNLATHRLFEKFLQEKSLFPEPLDPERFRMNIQIDGWEPFAELDLVDTFPGTREITIGNLRFQVQDACERCKVTHANPATGIYDFATVPLLKQFMQKYRPEYISPRNRRSFVMGLILVPLDTGTLNCGDALRL